MHYQFYTPSRAEVLSAVMTHVYELNLMKLEFGTYNLLELLGFGDEWNATIDEVDIQVEKLYDQLNARGFNFYYGAEYGGRCRIEAQREMLKLDFKMNLLRSFQNMAKHCLREYQIWLKVYFRNENTRGKVVRDHMNMLMLQDRYLRERDVLYQGYYP